jgi:hypothetical protein
MFRTAERWNRRPAPSGMVVDGFPGLFMERINILSLLSAAENLGRLGGSGDPSLRSG